MYFNIIEFRRSYEYLEISITPKVHAVFHHIIQFCSKHRMGLGFFGEQGSESVHHDFSEKMKNCIVTKLSENYWPKLLQTVCSYNSLHL